MCDGMQVRFQNPYHRAGTCVQLGDMGAEDALKLRHLCSELLGVDEELLRALQYIKDTVDRGERFAVRPKAPARLPSRGVSSSPSRLRVK